MTQREHVFKLIEASQGKGISSNELRTETHAVDVPKCVSDLNKEGAGIKSVENGDGTVTYFLEYQHTKLWVKTGPDTYGWVSQGVKRVSIKPKRKRGLQVDTTGWTPIDPMTGKAVQI